MGFWDTNVSPNLGQKTNFIIIHKKKRTCKIVDIAVLADHIVKLKESEMKDKYLDLGSSALVRQLVWEKEKSEFKPVKLRLKIVIMSYAARAEGLVNMINTSTLIGNWTICGTWTWHSY